jgi:MEMO1 family protein
MNRFFASVITICIAMNMFSQNLTQDREPYAAGRFYPADKETLKKDLSTLFATCVKPPVAWKVRAIISPHAGYVFSGKTAASAFSSIPVNTVYKNIFIIGSSHVMAFDGASVYDEGDFITPLGKARVNIEIAKKLKSSGSYFRFPVTSHAQEHSLEVQVPFIQFYFKTTPPIVPIIIGTNNKKTIKGIAEALRPYFNDENLFVISSDFSHYPSYKDANEVDRLTADAIVSKDPETFLAALSRNSSRSVEGLATSMCGWTSGLTLLYLSENNPNLEFRKISYCNSGDSNYGNRDEVVGYNALALIEKESSTGKGSEEIAGQSDVSFTKDEINRLFAIARTSISNMLTTHKMTNIDPAAETVNLNKKMGAFVTLKLNGNLRGCIGRFPSEDPLCVVVNQMAVASAFEDGRFDPLTADEYRRIEIEISVLGPLKKIKNISEIVIGKHGIYIKKDFRSGTMLPQVATENNWTLEEFLGYTSRDKAGLGWTGWKDADIYIYEAVVLEENKK